MNGGWPVRLTRRWVALYTRGLPDEIGDRRREEIDADLWCELEEASLEGHRPQPPHVDILIRLLAGIPADVSWRIGRGRGASAAPALDRFATRGTRAVGLLATVGGLMSSTLLVGFAVASTAPRPPNANPYYDPAWWPLLTAWLIAQLILSFATIGLVIEFQDRLHGFASVAGSIGGAAGLLGAVGAYEMAALLPLGAAITVWNLRAEGVLGRRVGAAFIASALAFLVVVVLVRMGVMVPVLAFLLTSSYSFAWLAIGIALRRGIPGKSAASIP
jgi:hypothetical protein